jgi:hypothetical protein
MWKDSAGDVEDGRSELKLPTEYSLVTMIALIGNTARSLVYHTVGGDAEAYF